MARLDFIRYTAQSATLDDYCISFAQLPFEMYEWTRS